MFPFFLYIAIGPSPQTAFHNQHSRRPEQCFIEWD
jgi:hypothetical protein